MNANEPDAFTPQVAEAARRNRARELREAAYRRARESRTGMFIYMALSSLALHRAAGAEPDPKVRRLRERLLTQRWSQMSQDILHIPFARPL
jgi:hypothetical protein